jgi:hypothetical protein
MRGFSANKATLRFWKLFCPYLGSPSSSPDTHNYTALLRISDSMSSSSYVHVAMRLLR